MMTFFRKGHFHAAKELAVLFKFPALILAGCNCVIATTQLPASIAGPGFGKDARQVVVNSLASNDVRQLIAALGDPQYVVRDEAESRLLKIGEPAIEPLRRTMVHGNEGEPDSEIRMRATRLLILIERKEHERKVSDFLLGKNDDLELPGWLAFSGITGSDKLSRQLFIDMHQAQPKLLAALKRGKNPVEELYQYASKRSLRTSSRSNASQSVATMNTMLFVSTLDLPSAQGDVPSRIVVSDVDLKRLKAVLVQPQMVTLVNNSGNQEQINRLISNWLSTLSSGDSTSINVQLAVIGVYQLKNKIGVPISWALNDRLPATTRTTAINVFGQLATAADVSEIEGLFRDRTLVGNYLPRDSVNRIAKSDRTKLMRVQLCDLALATSIRLNGHKVEDFGFDPGCYDGEKLVRNRCGFFSETDREAAFAKWSNTITVAD